MKNVAVLGIMLVGIIVFCGCSEEESPTEPSAPETGNLEGRVYYGNWIGIYNARVCVVNVECGMTVDRSWYVIEDIPAGNYMITASAPGYDYYQGSVRILANNDNQFHIKLEPSK